MKGCKFLRIKEKYMFCPTLLNFNKIVIKGEKDDKRDFILKDNNGYMICIISVKRGYRLAFNEELSSESAKIFEIISEKEYIYRESLKSKYAV